MIIEGDDEAGLEANSAALGVQTRTSKIADAGRGVFTKRAQKKGDTVGYMFGIIRSAARYQHILKNPSDAIGPEVEVAEDAGNGIFRAYTIESTVGEQFFLLMSRQCPVGLMNDSREKNCQNAVVAQPGEYSMSSSDTMHWNTFPVTLLVDVPAHTEIYLDYGWTNQFWKKTIELMKESAQRQADIVQRQKPKSRDELMKKQWANVHLWARRPDIQIALSKSRYRPFSGPIRAEQINDTKYVKLAASKVLPGLIGMVVAKHINREV